MKKAYDVYLLKILPYKESDNIKGVLVKSVVYGQENRTRTFCNKVVKNDEISRRDTVTDRCPTFFSYTE